MYDVKDNMLFVNGVNTHLKGSGYYALNFWVDSIKKSDIDCTLFDSVPKLISAKDTLFAKATLFLYFLPGSLFRVFRKPILELFYKVSITVAVRFFYNILRTRVKNVVFSHHSCFYLMFFIPKNKRILVIHDLLYVRSKSFGLPRWICKLTFIVEMQIYQRCNLICSLSYQEYKLLYKFLNVKVVLISVCETNLTLNVQKRNGDIALISDWRRDENREGVIAFFKRSLFFDSTILTLYIYGYGSKILLNQLRSLSTPNILWVDRGSFGKYSEVTPSSILICVEKGAGIKLKVIEAICQRKYILGTKAAFIGIPKKLLSNVSRQINSIDDCFGYIMKSSLTDGRFEDFVKAYNHLYKNIGMVLKEEMKYSFITNDD